MKIKVYAHVYWSTLMDCHSNIHICTCINNMPFCMIIANIPVLVLPELINDNRNIPQLVNTSKCRCMPLTLLINIIVTTASGTCSRHNKVIKKSVGS